MNALIASHSLLAIEGDKSSPVDLKENHSLETLDGVVNVNRKGTAVLVGHLQEPIETVKAEGSNRSLKSKREKFAKGLIGVSGDDDGYKKASGQKLEIVPESNVMKTRVGEEVTLKILLDGKPLKSQVYATYDGFSRRSTTFAYATESLDDGIAYVKVTSPGVWMVRVEKRIEANARDFDLLSLKATLIFSVQ
jgi:nickel transport protein